MKKLSVIKTGDNDYRIIIKDTVTGAMLRVATHPHSNFFNGLLQEVLHDQEQEELNSERWTQEYDCNFKERKSQGWFKFFTKRIRR